MRVPPGAQAFSFGQLAHNLRERHGAILIGIRPAGNPLNTQSILNPAFNATVEGGMFLDYISRKPVKIDWEEMQEILADQKS